MDSSTSRAPTVVIWASLLILLGLIGWASWEWRNSPQAEISRALQWLEQDRIGQACLILAGVEDQARGLPPVLNRAAVACLQAGATSAARRLLERSLRIQEGQGQAEKLLAAIYLSGGDEVRAVRLLEQAARRDARDFRPWFALGKVFQDQGKWDESAEAYQQALVRSPPPFERRESKIGRARALLDANRSDNADSLVAELRDAAPADPRVVVLGARLALHRGNAAEALELADRAVALDPSFDALIVRARIRFPEGLLQDAREDLEAALAFKPDDVGALQLLLQTQDALGLKAEAATTRSRVEAARRRRLLMNTISQAIQQNPEDAGLRFRMGQTAEEAGIITLAEQSFRASLDLDPSHRLAREALIELEGRRAATAAHPASP